MFPKRIRCSRMNRIKVQKKAGFNFFLTKRLQFINAGRVYFLHTLRKEVRSGGRRRICSRSGCGGSSCGKGGRSRPHEDARKRKVRTRIKNCFRRLRRRARLVLGDMPPGMGRLCLCVFPSARGREKAGRAPEKTRVSSLPLSAPQRRRTPSRKGLFPP